MSLHYPWRPVTTQKASFDFPWYGLLMSFKGPYNFMVTALGRSVKWPLEQYSRPWDIGSNTSSQRQLTHKTITHLSSSPSEFIPSGCSNDSSKLKGVWPLAFTSTRLSGEIGPKPFSVDVGDIEPSCCARSLSVKYISAISPSSSNNCSISSLTFKSRHKYEQTYKESLYYNQNLCVIGDEPY